MSFVKWRIQSLGHTVLVFLLYQVGHLKLPSNIFPTQDNVSSTLYILWCSFLLYIFQMLLPEKKEDFMGILFCFISWWFYREISTSWKTVNNLLIWFFLHTKFCTFMSKSVLYQCRSHHLRLTAQGFIKVRVQTPNLCLSSPGWAVGCGHTVTCYWKKEISPLFLSNFLVMYLFTYSFIFKGWRIVWGINFQKHSLGNCFTLFCRVLVALIKQPVDGLDKRYISQCIYTFFSRYILKLQILMNCNPVSYGSCFYISLQIFYLQSCQNWRKWRLAKV